MIFSIQKVTEPFFKTAKSLTPFKSALTKVEAYKTFISIIIMLKFGNLISTYGYMSNPYCRIKELSLNFVWQSVHCYVINAIIGRFRCRCGAPSINNISLLCMINDQNTMIFTSKPCFQSYKQVSMKVNK